MSQKVRRAIAVIIIATLMIPVINCCQISASIVQASERKRTGLDDFGKIVLSKKEFQRMLQKNQEATEDALESGAFIVEAGKYDVATFNKASHSNATNGVYSCYTTDALYNNMTRAQKQFYDRLYQTCESYLLGTGALYYNDRYGDYYTLPVLYNGLNSDEAEDILRCFTYSNPQFYYLSNGYMLSSVNSDNYLAVKCYKEFADGNSRANYTSRLFAQARSIIDSANGQSTIYNKLRTAEVLLARKVTYHSTGDRNGNYEDWDQSCCGAFLLNKGVCASYAEAYELICNALGAPTIAVTSLGHEWNQVYVNGRWYVVDVTWDDMDDSSGNVDDAYFLKSYATICSGTYPYNGTDVEDHTIEDETWRTVNVPGCSRDFTSSDNNGWQPSQTTIYQAEGNSYTGMAQYNGQWVYYQNGAINWSYTGMAYNDYGWWYYRNGQLDWNYTGLGVNEYGTWVYEGGRLNFNRNGMVNVDGTWRYADAGKIINYTGMANNEYGWWYYQNGILNWTYTGMACNDYGWWYYRNGNLDWNYTGMACNDYGWWYYQNGRLDWNYTGMACNEYGWWYYRNGNLDWNYTGMACNDYGWWYYTNGNINWNYTGMACNDYGWWYYQNGRLDWNYTGFGYNEYGAWLYSNGRIAWDYTGYWGGHYIVNGHVN